MKTCVRVHFEIKCNAVLQGGPTWAAHPLYPIYGSKDKINAEIVHSRVMHTYILYSRITYVAELRIFHYKFHCVLERFNIIKCSYFKFRFSMGFSKGQQVPVI